MPRHRRRTAPSASSSAKRRRGSTLSSAICTFVALARHSRSAPSQHSLSWKLLFVPPSIGVLRPGAGQFGDRTGMAEGGPLGHFPRSSGGKHRSTHVANEHTPMLHQSTSISRRHFLDQTLQACSDGDLPQTWWSDRVKMQLRIGRAVMDDALTAVKSFCQHQPPARQLRACCPASPAISVRCSGLPLTIVRLTDGEFGLGGGTYFRLNTHFHHGARYC